MRTRTAITAAIVAGVAIMAILRGSPSSRSDATQRVARGGALPRLPARLAAPPVEADADELANEEAELVAMAGQVESVDGKLASVDKLKRTLALYQEVTVYPPWSRPANDGSVPHLLHPNEPASMGQPFAPDASKRLIRTDVVLDRWFIGPGETATATLTISRDDQPGEPYEPDAKVMRVERYDPVQKAWPLAAELPLTRNGNAYVAVIDPAAIPVLASADPPPEVRLLARVQLGDFFKELPIIFRYTAKPAFRVLAMTGDRVADGSLDVDFTVDVVHAAPTLVQAVLYDESGTRPIATYDKQLLPAETGRQVMTLRFFGKVLRESGYSGRYRIKGLHGHVLFADREPGEIFWSHPDEPAKLTRVHTTTEFSDAPWSSPEQTRMVARYQELINQGGI